ncbi:hypothetical protein MUK42_25040 [Musa troglodytarum]|uniref:X8 domain-containing protein n=1 Tax=Musa troglodytarum TaxID=320322 RepID=A0A9E7IDC8_9LILI|nr:hypothetical protein MUK42_25040 [Musa troglodytarum]URE45823.1 hypothetical protein MUK42_25040 [Musa troglodytarum]
MANASFFLLILLLWSPRGDGLREQAKDAVATGGELWCVAKNNAEDAALQSALDWACGPGGADCRPIQQGGACYQPEDIQSHASFAFNDYFLRNGLAASACDFSGTAALTSLNPSQGSCVFPSRLLIIKKWELQWIGDIQLRASSGRHERRLSSAAENMESGVGNSEPGFSYCRWHPRSVQQLLRPCPFSTALIPFVRPCHAHRVAFSSATVLSASGQPRPWTGLQSWRVAPANEDRVWGPHGPSPPPTPPLEPDLTTMTAASLAECAALVLSTSDPLAKSTLSHLAYTRWCRREILVGTASPPHRPARPDRPLLVPPKEVPSHKSSGLPLNAYMLHNLAHVELNAIDLAWDTVVRFSPLRDELGDEFFADFAHVADDESRHFAWCSQRLNELGFRYGDMPAHNFLWRECEKSSEDVAARLAVIPLVQVFPDLLEEFGVELKGPFNYSARDEAGIPRDWYDGASEQEAKSELSEARQCMIGWPAS